MFELERESRHIPEPDLVPILDGLVCVIFFLLLSISFVGLTKLTVPPSTSAVSTTPEKPPLSPKVKVVQEKGNLRIELEWLGEKPAHVAVEQARDNKRAINKELIQKVTSLVGEFKTKFPEEKTMQLTMGEELSYQEMIAVMDGIRPHFDDIVLNSYKELEQ
jgi:biopolymer transport protein ExbD